MGLFPEWDMQNAITRTTKRLEELEIGSEEYTQAAIALRHLVEALKTYQDSK